MPSIWKAVLPAAVLCALAAGGARANYRVSYKNTAVILPTGINTDRGIAVNRNVNSPYYGYLYTCDSTGTARAVRILKPDNGIDSTTYTEIGTIVSGSSSVANPHDVAIGPDDTVWLANYGDRQIRSAPPVPTVPGTPEPSTVQINLPDFDGALPAGVVKSNPRALWVTGNVTDATVYIGEYINNAPNSNADIFNVKATNAKTTGTATRLHISNIALGAGPYGVTVDNNGNSYWAGGGQVKGGATLVKLGPDFVRDTAYKALLPAFQAQQNPQDVTFVPDASAVGGGYLYVSGYNTGAVNRYALDATGTWLDGYGNNGNSAAPLVIPVDAPYTLVNLSGPGGGNLIFGAADLNGYSYAVANPVTPNAPAVVKTLKLQPYVAAAGTATSASDAVRSSPTAVDGVVYFGSDDGKLYAFDTASGNPMSGFPVDTAVHLGSSIAVFGRPSVYVVNTNEGPTKFIYFMTATGNVCRVRPDGSDFRSILPTGTPGAGNSGAPAVTADGTVYVGYQSAAEGAGTFVAAINSDFTQAVLSPSIAPAGATITPVAAANGKLYVGVWHPGTASSILVLNAADLNVLSSGVAGDEGVSAPPYVAGQFMYVGTRAGHFYKVNSSTFAPDPSFGAGNVPATPGYAAVGEPLANSPFLLGGSFYAGSGNGKLWKIDAGTGAFQVAYDTSDSAEALFGVAADPASGTIAFGSSQGKFYKVPAAGGNAEVFRGYGVLGTTPTLDRATGRYFIGSNDKNVYTFK